MKNKKLSRALKVGAVSSLMLGGIVGTAAIVDTKDYKEVKDLKVEQTKLANVDNTDAGIVTVDLANTEETSVQALSTKKYNVASYDGFKDVLDVLNGNLSNGKTITTYKTKQMVEFSNVSTTKLASAISYYGQKGLSVTETIGSTDIINTDWLTDKQKEKFGFNIADNAMPYCYLYEYENNTVCLGFANDPQDGTFVYIFVEDDVLLGCFHFNEIGLEIYDGIEVPQLDLGDFVRSSIDDYPAWTSSTNYDTKNYNPFKLTYDALFGSGAWGYQLEGNFDADYPTISAGDIVVNVDNPLTLEQIKSCFKATDPTEGDLTEKIQFSDITYKLDSNGKIAVGKYSITATVADSSGNSATVTKTIHVVDVVAPKVSGKALTTGNSTMLTEADLLKQLTYSDNYYNKANLNVEFEYDDYKANYKKLGNYTITAYVTDPSGNIGQTTFVVTVKDTTNPVIKAANKTTGNSACLSQDELKALFTATDDVTASPTITIVSDNYTANYKKPGNYTVTAKATDAAGNTAQATATITVTDTTAPTISAINAVVSQSYTTKLTDAQLKALFKVSDDVSAADKITLEITSDTYTASYNKPGTYTVIVKATDEAGNNASASVTIKVIDDIKPVIVLTKQIKTTTQLPLTLEKILEYVKATDAIDGTITPTIKDVNSYLSKTNKPGTYTFEITATDKAGNVAKETLTLLVEDKDVPVISVSQYTITAAAGQVYKRSDIINFLKQTGQLTDEEAESVSIESDYFDSDNPVAGEYNLTITKADGTVQEMCLLVTESNDDSKFNQMSTKDIIISVVAAVLSIVLIFGIVRFIFKKKRR